MAMPPRVMGRPRVTPEAKPMLRASSFWPSTTMELKGANRPTASGASSRAASHMLSTQAKARAAGRASHHERRMMRA